LEYKQKAQQEESKQKSCSEKEGKWDLFERGEIVIAIISVYDVPWSET
jgi:hypothetical protein